MRKTLMTQSNGMFVNDLMHESINLDRATTCAMYMCIAYLKYVIF